MKTLLKVIVPVGILLGGAALAVLLIKSRRPVEPEAREVPLPLVRVASLTRGDHRFEVRAQGAVEAPIEINLVAEVAGRVVSTSSRFIEGGFFDSGEVLVTIDPRDYEVAVTRAGAALAEARVRLQREEAEAQVAREEWERMGGGPASLLLLREPQLAEARALVDSAQANLQKAQIDLDRCRIGAPFAGRLRVKNADIGQFLNRGEPVARIYSVDCAEVPLPLPLDDVAWLNLPVHHRGEAAPAQGPRVTLSARVAGRTLEWTGSIVRTHGEIDARTRMITVVARVEDPYGRGNEWTQPPLAVGLFVDARIEGRVESDVFTAPRSAFREDRQLKMLDSDDRLHLVEVERLRVESDTVVFRAGLVDGVRVVVTPMDVVTDGMQVRVIDGDTPGIPAS